MAISADEPDQHFALGQAAWRQFFGLYLDEQAPSQPEVDARLLRYQRAHETGALRDFAASALMIAGIGKVLVDGMAVFGKAQTATEILVFVLTCVLIAVIANHCLTRLRGALEHRGLAQRIGTESVPWSKVDALFADVRDHEVRNYIQGVRAQGRPLRRTETAVLLERSRGSQPYEDTSEAAFGQAVRGRSGPTRAELAAVSICLLAGLATHWPDFNGAALSPALWLLGATCLAQTVHTLLQLMLDPWGLRGGGDKSRQLRAALYADTAPQLAVILVVVLTAGSVSG